MAEQISLSIIVLNYNTKDLLQKCLTCLKRVRGEVNFEVIVSDNASTDGSVEMLSKDFKWVKVIGNTQNLGFARGNNQARAITRGKNVLFLNSDTEVPKNTLKETLKFLTANPKVGAVTCRIILPNGNVDRDTRRSFPTPWVTFTHFSHLDRVFPKSKLFARYWYGYKPVDVANEVDVIQGAYFMTRIEILDEVNWFDEDYFLDGEDIDLCWKIKNKGWQIFYYPKVNVLHLKGATKGKTNHSFGKVTQAERVKYVLAGVNSMEIFYKKRLWNKYPLIVNLLVVFGIKLIRAVRYIKAFLT